jgi:hypothetical protein
MSQKAWKVAAIILAVIVLLQTSLIIWAWNAGNEAYVNEEICAINHCNEHDSYFYDDLNKVCHCYENKEIVKTSYLGN